MENGQLSETAKNIVNQAQNWSFEGDCMLLQWMEQISQNLESRAKATTEGLDKVTKNLVRSQIALENTQNSLNALQFTQYVEMRCQEDELPVEIENTKDDHEEKPKKELLKVFLQNNLNMLHNCHDKFNFLDDSDEDDVENVASAESCIYQPRNPYNERLLPHIYGTKMWKENWHVGICEEGEQNYSGDETSDVYSLSSSSSGEHESIESHNTENLSQWTSSVSLNNESSNNNNNKAVNSKTNSLTFSLPIPQTMHIPHQPTQPIEERAKNIEKETVENPEPAISTDNTNKNNKKSQQSKETLNLFDDNDFKSLLSEVTDKERPKQDIYYPQSNIPARKEREKSKDLFESGSNRPASALPQPNQVLTQKIATVNLFDSPTDDFPPVKNFEQPNTNSKIDLFEDLESFNPNKQSFLTDAALPTPSSKIHKKTMISAKSLFDDDEDDGDEDFLNMFGKPKPSGNSKQSFTSAIFDDDLNFQQINQPKLNEKIKEFSDDESLAQQAILPKSNNLEDKNSLFLDDSNDDENEFMFAKSKVKSKDTSSIPKQDVFKKQSKHTTLPVFKDFADDDIFHNIPSPAPRKVGAVKNESSKPILAYMSSEPPEDVEDQHEKQHQPREMDAADDSAPFMSAEPPKDIEEQYEKQQSKATKPKEVHAAVEADDLFSLLSNPIAEVKTKHSIFDDDDDDDNLDDYEKTTINSVETITSAVEDFSLGSNPTELGNESSNSSLNDKKAVLGTAFLVKELPSTSEVMSHELQEPQETPEREQSPLQISKEISQPIEFEEVVVISDDANKLITQTPHMSDVIKPTTYDYSPLFSDEPPDDDFFQVISGNLNVTQTNIEHDFFEPTTSKQKVSETKTEVPAHLHSTYGIGLFSDIPPEDEESTNNFLEPVSTNRADSNNLKVASNLDLSSPTAIFKTMPIDGKDDRDHQAISKPKSVLSKFKPPKETTTDNEPKTTVSKLKMPTININVQALLPNAVGKPKILTTRDSADNIPPQAAIPILTSNEILQKELPLEAGRENLLPNLCKNRVRGPLKRKASTRAGRQESYRKTLENEEKLQKEEQAAENLESIYKKPKNPLTVPVLEEHSSSNNKISHSDNKNILSGSVEAPNRLSLTKPTTDHYPKANLFQEFDDAEENDDFLSSLKSQGSEKVEQKSSENAQKPMPLNSKQPQEQKAPEAAAGSNLFRELDETEDNDDFLSSLKRQSAKKIEQKSLANSPQPLHTNPTQAAEKPHTSASSNLFKELNDAEENDDFLSSFKPQGAEKTEQKTSTNTTKSSTMAFESDDDLFDQSSGAIQKPIHEVSSQLTSRQTNASQSKKSNTLFGSDSNDDDDEDDDLFRSLSKPKMPVKVSTSSTKESKGNNKSLFSDSEDDDDLFGNSAAKTKKADLASKVAATVKKSTIDSQLLIEKTKSTAPMTSDNPLADLLNS